MAENRVSPGPFATEPIELGRLLSERFSPAVPGEEVVRRCDRWLVELLEDSGVTLGAFDAEVAHLLAVDGWSVAQVVGGWVRRAHRAGSVSAAP